MANVIRHKRGTSNPVAGDFSQTAELLVNTTDGGLFTKTDGGSVVEIGGDKLPLSGGTLTGDLTAGLVTVDALASSSSLARQYQTYYSGSSYLVDGEYQKVVTVIPSGSGQNYQIVGRMIAQSGSNAQTINFNALLRSNTYPDLSWTISYTEELMGSGQYITPQLWTKETTTAGFVLAFEVHAQIYGNVTCDFLVIPRNSSQHSNVTVNTDSTSEQSSVDTGYTARDFTLNTSLSGVNITYNGDIKFEGSTADAYETTLTATDPTADRTITLPDATGTIWTSGNDGSGSGLDADLLDGQQGSYYAPLASPTFTGTPAAPTASAGTNTTQVATTAFVQTAVEGVVDSAPGALDTLNELAAALGDDANFSTTVTNSIAEKLPKSGGTMTGDLVVTTGQNNGVFWGSAGPNITNVSANTGDLAIQNIDQLRFGSSSAWDWNAWAGIAFDSDTEVLTIGGPASSAFTSNSNPPNITINFDGLSGTNGLTYEGSTIWHAGNDGSGSGLDADTVDGVHASSFFQAGTALSATTGTFSGNVTINANAYIQAGNVIQFGTTGTRDKLRFWSSSSYAIGMDDSMSFGALNDYAMTFQFNNDADRGFWWGHNEHSDAQGAMSLTTGGKLVVADSFRVGGGTSDTTAPAADIDMAGTGAIKVANGTTAQRPTGANGMMRYNTTLGAIESYVQGAWQVIANTALDYGLITSASDTTFDYGALS